MEVPSYIGAQTIQEAGYVFCSHHEMPHNYILPLKLKVHMSTTLYAPVWAEASMWLLF